MSPSAPEAASARGRERRVRLILVGIVILALALRLALVLTQTGRGLRGDALGYRLMAHQLVDRGVYGYALGRPSGAANAYVPPGYPLVLAAAYLVGGDGGDVPLVRGVQAAVGAVTPLLAYALLRRLGQPHAVGLAAALLVAVYPPYVGSPVSLLTETLALATLLGSLVLTLAALERRSPGLAVLAGGAVAVHGLIRPLLLPLAALPFLAALLPGFRRARGPAPLTGHTPRGLVRLGLWTVVGAVLVMAPWWARNVITLHQLVLVGTGAGDPFLAGTYPGGKGLFLDYHRPETRSLSELRFGIHRLVWGLRHHPLPYLRWYTVGKIVVQWGEPWLPTKRLAAQEVFVWAHRLLVLMGGLGLLLGSVRDRGLRFLALFTLAGLGLLLVFLPEPRYAYELVVFLLSGCAWLAVGGGAEVRALWAARVGAGGPAQHSLPGRPGGS